MSRTPALCERRWARAVALATFWLLLEAAAILAQGVGAVRAVLFVSPRCPHCRTVREEVLPIFAERFGARVEIALVSTATPSGVELFRAACRRYGVSRPGVPMLVVGDRVLLGARQIPDLFPALAEEWLAAGGSPWPEIPGLEELVAPLEQAAKAAPAPATSSRTTAASRAGVAPGAAPAAALALEAADTAATAPPVEPARATPTPEPTRPAPRAIVPASAPAAAESPSDPAAGTSTGEAAPGPLPVAARPLAPLPEREPRPEPPPPRTLPSPPPVALRDLTAAEEVSQGLLDRIALDPQGNSLAILVLLGMTLVAARSALLVPRWREVRWQVPESWTIPVLALAGLGVAAYLSWVEIGGAEAVCGPVGDCNTVQQSAYATLFGIVPIGVLGVVGFAAILLGWWAGRLAAGRARAGIGLALFALTGCGTLFSIYLTFLEPFVIGATCLWCLGSAVIMTLLHRLSAGQDAAAAPAPESVRAKPLTGRTS